MQLGSRAGWKLAALKMAHDLINCNFQAGAVLPLQLHDC